MSRYTVKYYSDEIPDALAKQLENILPHGSGIDYDWYLEFRDNPMPIVQASNSFHAMNDGGYYCHAWPFVVEIPVEVDEPENRYWIPTAIAWHKIDKLVVKFVDCDPEDDCPSKQELADYFSEFEKDEDDEYDDDVYENAPMGCGFGLGDYLDEVIYFAFSEAKPKE